MHYSTRNHTAFATANYEVNARLSFFANLVYNDGRGSLGGINLDTTQVPAIPAGFDYAAVSEIGRFSALSGRRTQQIYGMNYQLSPHWVLSWVAYHGRYTDRQPYLFDANGRTSGAQGGINFVF
jgi:hypothetical protein